MLAGRTLRVSGIDDEGDRSFDEIGDDARAQAVLKSSIDRSGVFSDSHNNVASFVSRDVTFQIPTPRNISSASIAMITSSSRRRTSAGG
ncbi:hypothetical protein [Rhizobium leguminosarum]|uniref:hypothetical protein n=1 Tax=Rhizobium leguminosarum TaxID=384 RepID=UPI003D0381BC